MNRIETKMRLSKRFFHNPHVVGYIFISPWLIGFICFTVVPMLASLYLSVTDFNLLSKPNFIGLYNFKRMFTEDRLFSTSLSVTFIYVLAAVPLRLIFALMIALILSKRHRFVGFYRTAYYIPSLFGSSVAIALAWRMLFGESTPLAPLLGILGMKDVILINNPNTAMGTIVAMAVWQFGSSMLIFLAGLNSIPDSYYEAAIVDGAGFRRKLFRITIPLLSPVILFNLVMQTIYGFILFPQAFIVTRGGPMNCTLVYALYLFKRAFTYGEMGYASAMAWILLLILSVLTAMLFLSSKSWVFYESK